MNGTAVFLRLAGASLACCLPSFEVEKHCILSLSLAPIDCMHLCQPFKSMQQQIVQQMFLA